MWKAGLRRTPGRDSRLDGFTLTYDGYEPAEEGLREALTSTGNGYFCTRGAAEWEDADDVHYPGTYAHGGYNRETTIMGGMPVPNEDLVNLPNWLVLKLRIEGEEVLRLADVELLSYRHEYDIRNAVLSRTLRFRDRAGRTSTLRSRRFVSMAHGHQAAIEWTLTPEDWSGRVEVISALDGRVTNRGVARYRELEGRHLEPVFPRTFGPDVIALMVRTRQSRIHVAQAARTRVFSGDEPVDAQRRLHQMEDYVQTVLAFDVTQGAPVRVEKMVALYTSHDRAISEPLGNAGKSVGDYPSFGRALADHRSAWDELWEACDLVLPGNARVQLLLRLHIAHVLQVCSRHTAEHGRRRRRARPERRGVPRATCSGTSCTCSRSSTSACRGSAGTCSSTGRAGWGRRAERRGRPAIAARCTRGRAAATARRRPRSCTSTRSPGAGSRTSATTSAT